MTRIVLPPQLLCHYEVKKSNMSKTTGGESDNLWCHHFFSLLHHDSLETVGFIITEATQGSSLDGISMIE